MPSKEWQHPILKQPQRCSRKNQPCLLVPHLYTTSQLQNFPEGLDENLGHTQTHTECTPEAQRGRYFLLGVPEHLPRGGYRHQDTGTLSSSDYPPRGWPGQGWAGCKGLLVPLLLDPASGSPCFLPGEPFHFSVSVDAGAQEGGVWPHILLPLISVTLKSLQHPVASLSSHLPLKSLSKDGYRLQPFQLPGAGPSQAVFSLLLACLFCPGLGWGLKPLFQSGQCQSFSLPQVLSILAGMTWHISVCHASRKRLGNDFTSPASTKPSIQRDATKVPHNLKDGL